MNYLAEFWDWLTKGRYTRNLERAIDLLEAEKEQLRLENRALLNSILGTAGVAPIEAQKPLKEIPRMRRRSWFQIRAKESLRLRQIAEASEPRKTETKEPEE